MKRLTKTVALRLTPQLHRLIVRERERGETLSETIRRLLQSRLSPSFTLTVNDPA